MSMLGDFLPKSVSDAGESIGSGISTAANSVTNFISSGTSNFSLAGAKQKLAEGAEKMLGSFGNVVGFKNLTKGVPALDLAEQLRQQGIGIGPDQVLSDATETAASRENLDDVIVSLISTVDGAAVYLEASPRIGESRQANYTELNITHHPGAILKYDRTSSRSWNASARLISRTPEEASRNQHYLNTIRSWVMPYYGEGTEKTSPSLLGAPPPILRFSGYGTRNISPIPVVMESYSTNWPNDVDYIPTLDGAPFPVIIDVDMNLKESYSPREYSNFDLFAYKSGDLSTAFSASSKFAQGGVGRKANAKTKSDEPAVLGAAAGQAGKPSAAAVAGTGSQNPGADLEAMAAERDAEKAKIKAEHELRMAQMDAQYQTVKANSY